MYDYSTSGRKAARRLTPALGPQFPREPPQMDVIDPQLLEQRIRNRLIEYVEWVRDYERERSHVWAWANCSTSGRTS